MPQKNKLGPILNQGDPRDDEVTDNWTCVLSVFFFFPEIYFRGLCTADKTLIAFSLCICRFSHSAALLHALCPQQFLVLLKEGMESIAPVLAVCPNNW